MNGRIDKKELSRRVATCLEQDGSVVEKMIDVTLEEIYEALKREESVSLRNFGTFYIWCERNMAVFKFNPSQRLRALFNWSSTYRGNL